MPTVPSAASTATDRRRLLGRQGEDAAARWYTEAGYEVVDRNWRCPGGEIDLVAVGPGGTVIVFCEVKTRSSSAFGSPEEAVTLAKQRRLRRLAGRWLVGQRASRCLTPSVRFDVAAVIGPHGGHLDVTVVEDAF